MDAGGAWKWSFAAGFAESDFCKRPASQALEEGNLGRHGRPGLYWVHVPVLRLRVMALSRCWCVFVDFSFSKWVVRRQVDRPSFPCASSLVPLWRARCIHSRALKVGPAADKNNPLPSPPIISLLSSARKQALVPADQPVPTPCATAHLHTVLGPPLHPAVAVAVAVAVTVTVVVLCTTQGARYRFRSDRPGECQRVQTAVRVLYLQPDPVLMSGSQSPPAAMEHDDYFSTAQLDDQHPSVAHIDDSDTDMAASASSSRAVMFSSSAAHAHAHSHAHAHTHTHTHMHARKPSRMSRSGAPRPIITPTSPLSSTIPHNLLPSAPASPPTPAPSPTPTQRVPDWSTAAEHEDSHIKNIRANFSDMNRAERLRLLGELLNLCDSQELSFVAEFVSPRLKKDPFMELPTELCLRILECVDDPTTLARASQVSKKWRELVNDDGAWRLLCQKYSFRSLTREMDEDSPGGMEDAESPWWQEDDRTSRTDDAPSRDQLEVARSQSQLHAEGLRTQSLDREAKRKTAFRRPTTYRSHFKQRYMVETAWRNGGVCDARQITPDQGVVTSLHLTRKYIVVALDNAKIHVFDTVGDHQKTLQGHVMGVWAMVPWGDLLVSGGCDRDVRVWNLATGFPQFTLRGHTSTVRCLKMSDSNTAISGSRDTTLRIWDLTKGLCKHVLIGHQASVRCLEIYGDIVVSGSYDTTAKIWSISEGKCLRTLTGHFSQIYAIAFDGKKIATGSLDTSVRIWDPNDGKCLAVLQGHTSLVGQLQMREDILVTGGSDGSVRVWSLANYQAVHRLAAHDNSVTSLQFDNTRIVSGGSDGRVKVWDLKTGTLVRELSSPAEAVWRVVFEEEKAVIMASRGGRTIMEVWDFSPPPESDLDSRAPSPASMPDHLDVEYNRPRSAILPVTSPLVQHHGVGDVTMGEAGES
ncbi:hypothetical protein LEMA_P105900.1 [Plenodomus lingam JN3]|uniref:F-box domain-containing protein n=1 Tax=Leptosphaeria maculans (strain JN3 / isolate v23.1.3 / race Av1-4-5-6-7-8) TaxID=985895 RepID=E5A1J5_LEPMJ|nr:hypothetical protein LEMA_P105900.1 [Plenodomus lingam JN3]CBX97459.1 hypothetical protein LEMA_P105900.1 [Plenodomus lingam JN3]